MDISYYKTHTLVEVAYKALKKDITERVFLPGQKIILREVSLRYGISDTPIKQALNRLIAEGVIESIPRKGVRVREIHWKEIEELIDIRLMIETAYIEQTIRTFKSNSKLQGKILKNVKEHRRMIEHVEDVDDYFKNYYLDLEFHQLFVKCSANQKMVAIYNNLGTHAYSYYVYRKQDREGMINGVKEHETICQALLNGNPEELRRCVEVHIVNAKKNVFEMLQESLKRPIVSDEVVST